MADKSNNINRNDNWRETRYKAKYGTSWLTA